MKKKKINFFVHKNKIPLKKFIDLKDGKLLTTQRNGLNNLVI